MKNKFIVGMSKVAIATVLSTAMAATPVLASTGDLWKGSSDIGSVTQLILHPNTFLDLLAHMSSYSYEVNGKGYDVAQSDALFKANPTASAADVQAMIEAQLTPVTQTLTVASVSAINSTVVTVDNGTTMADAMAKLDQSVTLTLSDGSTKDAAIVWSCDNYDAATAGDYTFTGKVTLPDNVTDPDSKVADVSATVTVNAVEALTVENVSAINSTTLGVAFNRALTSDEQSKAQFAATYNNTAFNISAVTWSTDGMTAQFSRQDAAKLAAGTYAVSVT
ncbi:Ig-like domain-containing protein, partial [Desulfosporosinus sp. PR]|uniref:Ig-like domain-containing protein n=1 Tax=Candidatus Desulfosporosinus nitrosoreducens TaxID=3401928 RepID=UPI0027E79145